MKKFTKKEVFDTIQLNHLATDGDIFKVVRQFEDIHASHNTQVVNKGEIYWWLKEKRDEEMELYRQNNSNSKRSNDDLSPIE